MNTPKHALLLLTLILIPGFAQAGTITEYTLDDCDDQGCDGASLKLTIEDVGNDMFIAEYSIITDGTQTRLGMNQIGFLGIKDYDTAELIGAPNGLDAWGDVIEGPIAANSTCSKTNDNTSKLCVTGFVDMSDPDEYTWTFKINGGEILGEEDIHFSGQWANSAGRTPGMVLSANLPGAAVPEPSSALVFAIGTLLVTSRLKRRQTPRA
jgi:hypothetical protein